MIIASPTPLAGGRRDYVARSCAVIVIHCSSLFFGSGEWARRGLNFNYEGVKFAMRHKALSNALDRYAKLGRGAAALLVHCF